MAPESNAIHSVLEVLMDKDTAHLMILSGGAWRGAYQYWVIVYLLAIYKYESIHGVSVGAVNGVMAAMKKTDQLLEFWEQLDGLGDYLTLRWFYLFCYVTGLVWAYERLTGRAVLGGVYAMDGLFTKLQEFAHLDDLETPFGAGVVSLNSGKYYTLDSRDMVQDVRLAKACLVSSCMAPFMTPPQIHLEGDTAEPEIGFDGGGRNIFPFPKMEISRLRAEGKKVVLHVVGCTPLERISRVSSKQVSGPVAIALRALEVLEAEVFDTDLLQLREAIGEDGELHLWVPQTLSEEELALEQSTHGHEDGYAPIEVPGDSFAADKNTISGRLRESRRMVQRGPIILKSSDAPQSLLK